MAIKGAILGDIAGSQYEYNRPQDLKWRLCDLFTDNCHFTDDTVMSLAIKYAIDKNIDYQEAMRKIGQCFPDCGYGPTFFTWMFCHEPKPYNSFGNGAAMRVAYIGESFDTLTKVQQEAIKSAQVSHSHPEGIKGAAVTASCIWMAKHGYSRTDILSYASEQYPKDCYAISPEMTLDKIRKVYTWDITCMTCVPVAIRCFYESQSYQSFLRNVFSLDCDMDTICAIGGAMAEEFYHDTELDEESLFEKYLPDQLYQILMEA